MPAAAFPVLERLFLGRTGLGPVGLAALLHGVHCGNRGCGGTENRTRQRHRPGAGGQEQRRRQTWPCLRFLDLHNSTLGTKGANVLVASAPPTLEVVRLSSVGRRRRAAGRRRLAPRDQRLARGAHSWSEEAPQYNNFEWTYLQMFNTEKISRLSEDCGGSVPPLAS